METLRIRLSRRYYTRSRPSIKPGVEMTCSKLAKDRELPNHSRVHGGIPPFFRREAPCQKRSRLFCSRDATICFFHAAAVIARRGCSSRRQFAGAGPEGRFPGVDVHAPALDGRAARRVEAFLRRRAARKGVDFTAGPQRRADDDVPRHFGPQTLRAE